MTVRELRIRMDSEELSRWLAYDRLDLVPDPWREMGILASTIATALTGRAFKPDDFIPRPRRVRILSSRAGFSWMKGIAAGLVARMKSTSSPKV